MEHKPNILLVGIADKDPFKNMAGIGLSYCTTAQAALELFIEKDFHLLICAYTLPDKSAPELHQSLQSFLQLYPSSPKKDTKLLVITHTLEEEKICKEKNISYFPDNMDLVALIRKLITLPSPEGNAEANLMPIDFDELFHRVDNNRQFIQSVFEKFLDIYPSRLHELQELTQSESFQATKDSAHRLKGVLANFSMKEARQTIIQIEKSALAHDANTTMELIRQLQLDIERAKQYYLDHQDLFSQ